MKRAAAVIVVFIALAVVLGAIYWFFSTPKTLSPEAKNNDTARAGAPSQPRPAQPSAPAEHAPESAPAKSEKEFCARDFDAVDAREADADALRRAGGLVYVFEREARLADPYGCAAFYLAHGLDIDAIDPRPAHGRLTGLDFAIQRNDPKMLRFMIDHGADLTKRATTKNIKPMGYAYLLAFSDDRINRNRVISILNDALEARAADGGAEQARNDRG